MSSREAQNLAQAWSVHGRAKLDSYLVQEVENPCFNPQSVLVRNLFADVLTGGAQSALINEELYYSACATFAVLGHREGWFGNLLESIRAAADGGDDSSLPDFLKSEFQENAGPSFSVAELFNELDQRLPSNFGDDFISPFAARWKQELDQVEVAPSRPRVLELAMGSANDARYFPNYGIGRHLNFTGIDICPENVANARSRWPEATFEVGDAMNLPFDDGTFDVVTAFDLYEHLSPQGLDDALRETVRVSHDQVWLSFFNLAETPFHDFREEGLYHWNELSRTEIENTLAALGCSTQTISLVDEIESRFPGYRHYNREAHLVLATRPKS